MPRGGDLLEITCNHPILGDFRFDPKGSEDTEVDFGGYMKQDADDSVTGAGTDIVIMNRKRWSVVSPPLAWEQNPDTLQTLQSIQSNPEPATFTFTFIDGSVYKGTGHIYGDVKGNKNAATVNPLKFAGGGQLEDIA